MDPAVFGLLGVVIGTVTSIATTIIANLLQRRLERQKSLLEIAGTMTEELRTYIAQAAQAMLAAQHSMEWICWFGLQGPRSIDDQIISQYHKEIHETFPRLLGALAVVASFDSELYDDLARLAEKIYRIDGKIGRALERYNDSPEDVAKMLAEHHPEAAGLYRNLPLELTEIMKSARERMYLGVVQK